MKLVALDGDTRFPRDQRAAAVDAFRDRRLEHDACGRAAAARACFTALNGRNADGKRICDFAHLGQTRPAGERETGVAQGVAGGVHKKLARELGRRHPFSTDIPARSTGWGLITGPCQAASAVPTSEDSGVIDQSNRGFPEGPSGPTGDFRGHASKLLFAAGISWQRATKLRARAVTPSGFTPA